MARVMEDDGRDRAFVEFYYHPQVNRAESEKAGHVVHKDVEFARITPPGGNLVVEKRVTDEIRERYRGAYEAWLQGVEAPVEGTALRDWPPITPAQLVNCRGIHVYTVEALAALPEGGVQKLGIGARALVAKAQAWLADAAEHGVAAEQVSALTVRMEALEEQNRELMAINRKLRAELGDEPAPVKRGPGRPRKNPPPPEHEVA